MKTASFKFFPANISEAQEAIKNASSMCLFVGILNAIAIAIIIFKNGIMDTVGWIVGISPIILIFGLAYGIYKKNRLSAIAAFMFVLAAVCINFDLLLRVNPIVSVGAVIILFTIGGTLLRGILGTYVYHRLLEQ